MIPKSPSTSTLSPKFYRCTAITCKSFCLVSTPYYSKEMKTAHQTWTECQGMGLTRSLTKDTLYHHHSWKGGKEGRRLVPLSSLVVNTIITLLISQGWKPTISSDSSQSGCPNHLPSPTDFTLCISCPFPLLNIFIPTLILLDLVLIIFFIKYYSSLAIGHSAPNTSRPSIPQLMQNPMSSFFSNPSMASPFAAK